MSHPSTPDPRNKTKWSDTKQTDKKKIISDKSVGCIALSFSQSNWKVTAEGYGNILLQQFPAERVHLTTLCMERVHRLLDCKMSGLFLPDL